MKTEDLIGVYPFLKRGLNKYFEENKSTSILSFLVNNES